MTDTPRRRASDPVAKVWWQSRTAVALVVVIVGAVLLVAGSLTASADLTTAGTLLVSLAAPVALASRVGATQPLTLTRAKARKTERTQ